MSDDQTNNTTADNNAEAVAQAAEALANETTESSDSSNEVLKLKAERDAYYEQVLRATAEMDNFRKRMRREMEEAARYQYQPLIRDMLSPLDNLARTIQAAEKSGNIESLLEGLRMVLKQFDDTFAKVSARPIQTVGQPFDPNLHEALMQVPSPEHPAMTVMQEVERGYTLHERVIRPAKVVVSTGKPAS